MDRVTQSLEELGRQVAWISDASASPEETLARVKGRLEGQPAVVRPGRFWQRPWVLGPVAAAATLAVATVVVFTLLSSSAPGSLAFTIDGRAVQSPEGAFVEAKQRPVELRFSEGTRIEVLPGAGLHVVQGQSQRVALLLERGSARLRVKRRTLARWSVRAGPFTVVVTGTRFEMSWDPAARRFQLELAAGSVEVTGPHLPSRRRIVAGERLEVHVDTGKMTISRDSGAKPQRAASPAAERAPAPTLSQAPRDDTASDAPRAHSAEPPPAPSWERLARAGQYQQALAQVKREGFGAVLQRSNASETWLLADTARFAAEPRLARQALQALRTRHGARGQSAFLLGKIAADHLGAGGEALRWFETYLKEAPGGALREQALGRSLELLRQSAPDRARSAARRYLREYPGGAYAALAQSLVDPSAPAKAR